VFGIELLDIRFKRINYNESVRPKIYDRMISERRQIAERFLSEGNGEAARIGGNRVRDLIRSSLKPTRPERWCTWERWHVLLVNECEPC
jgi:regulator of protease activity HflC (stomatin/prohibitin superfamily)